MGSPPNEPATLTTSGDIAILSKQVAADAAVTAASIYHFSLSDAFCKPRAE